MKNREIIGHISKQVIEKLSLDIKENTPIFISDSNTSHIRESHPDAYSKYYDSVAEIIDTPDYVGIAGVYAPSIEFIKRFEKDDEIVNVAVRATKTGTHYLRSMFIIEEGRLNDYIKKGR